MVLEANVLKIFKQTFRYVKKVTVLKLLIEFWTVTANHQVNKYWAFPDLLLLTKKIRWDGF